ncbi:transporter substrate-binding domain-containing protein [Bradyrhizobium sp. 180]|uniref:transporter substrate-binding domain-containing protein n=1 Tax=Bradyrhizobium sp. 180 TaxID=2782650 RepID=UPI001FF9D520|nr:transporter substrate-binding domain-containing protein [Bradyrhizobium sp. 180]MCK1492466.1 transporter substrate-binding domain-containing protein [Bradyrhizobium sp. 180]
MKTIVSIGVFVLAIVFCATTASRADTLQDIVTKRKLVAGIKTDYPPWGMRDKDGQIVGLEIDLVRDFARRIGQNVGEAIEVELVPVVASNRMQFLQQGRIDVMIATMNDLPERRKVVGSVYPDYYSSGVAVFARKDAAINDFESLGGKPICGVQGTWYNRDWGAMKGAEMVIFPGAPEVEKALLDGRCVGWLYDDSAFVARQVTEPAKWKDFKIATPVVGDVPWAAAVRLEDLQAPIGKLLADTIIDWHRSGMIADLEKKWGIPPTKWVAMMHEACNTGAPQCATTRPPTN